jgi:putative iron-dependent peroxidase
MTTLQAGILALGTRTHHQIELDLRPDARPDALIAAVRTLLEGTSAGDPNVVIGFGDAAWRAIARPDQVPDDLAPFTEIVGPEGHRAPSTQHDVWIWVHGTGTDAVLDTAWRAVAAFDDVALIGAECPCFVYHDSRDLTGFIDGTANPAPHEAAAVAVIPADRRGAGGTHVLTQRWLHDLAAFERMSVADQERVIGRRKGDSAALSPGELPPTAHIARAEVVVDGEEQPVWRRSVPFGTVGERGLYFLAFSADRWRVDTMLAQMYGTSGDGLRDSLLDYSTPMSGAFYFAPGQQALADLLT